jgi:hypothetical protein
VRFIGVLCARAIVRLPVKQRGKPFEQGGDLLIVEQSRGDEELAGPRRDEGGIRFKGLLDEIPFGEIPVCETIGASPFDWRDGIRSHAISLRARRRSKGSAAV